MTRAPRSPRACLRSPEKRKKTTPVLQANRKATDLATGLIYTVRTSF